jgi:ABC-type branched-subunit amino acid transport system ATPase component
MTSTTRLAYEGVGKHFGGIDVFDDVSFSVAAGTVTALIGPNGAGKSTLINLTCGVFPPDRGRILKDGVPLGHGRPSQALDRSLARTFQDVRLFGTLSVIENVLVAMPGQIGDAPWRLFGTRWLGDERRHRAAAMELLEVLGLAADAERPAGGLPFGTQKLIALARAVATGADTLLLDETTTGLELTRIPLVMACLRDLRAQGRTILLVEHNMDVVADVADQVVVLHGRVIASGSADSVLHDDRVIREYLGRIYHA